MSLWYMVFHFLISVAEENLSAAEESEKVSMRSYHMLGCPAHLPAEMK